MSDFEMDCDVAPDASRTFRPMPRRRDYSALKAVIAVVLVAAGCALLITAGSTPVLAVGP